MNHARQLSVFSFSFTKDDYTACILDFNHRCQVALDMDHLFRRIMLCFTAIVTAINNKYGVSPRLYHISSQSKTLRSASDAHHHRSLKHVRGVLCDQMSLSGCYHIFKFSNHIRYLPVSDVQIIRSCFHLKSGFDDVNSQDTSRIVHQLNRFVLFLNNNQALASSPPCRRRCAKPSKTGVEKI
jgi:hypothetical protein